MLSNFHILQQIHQQVHEINRIKNKSKNIQRDRWSKVENNILFDAIQVIGNRDYEAISALIMSKSSSQVYQRLRYLREHLDNFIPDSQQ
ncbi:SANT/Myb_domain [Hexamita inflata]|uniref:SANT/Myb domain n=1 Tax=Hexamita inflata TaxID=28002 RepID=A0AA86RFC8_9EUKA|nr:SANT/Myb domain [Hexamita inflata]